MSARRFSSATAEAWASSNLLSKSSTVCKASANSRSACSRCSPAVRMTSATRRSAAFTALSFSSTASAARRSVRALVTAATSSATSMGNSATGSALATACELMCSSHTCLSREGFPPPTRCRNAKPVMFRPAACKAWPASMIDSGVNSAGRIVGLLGGLMASL